MSQAGFTPIQLYYSSAASAAPSAGNLASGELALNITDGKLFYKDNGGSVQVLATKAGANGDVVGPASATDNALVRFDTTTGKLVQNSVGILSDTGALSGLTDISASGSVTLSGGTANGVAYLNGSKVLTSGSALTFDGTKLSLPTVLAIKGAQNSNLARIAMTRTDQSWSINNETDLRFYGQGTDTETPSSIAHSMGNTGIFVWNNANTASEQMRLTSTGLGIGTSSPGAKLDVNGDARIGNATAGTNRQLSINGVVNKASRIAFQESGTDRWLIGNGAASENGNFEIYDATNGNNFILTRSGNLGLGVTPSAWGSSYKALQLGARGSLYAHASVGATLLGENVYDDGTAKYIASAAAARYQMSAGVHYWYNAPSGTAGNAISFTQAMTLDASGALLVGDTSNRSNQIVVNAPASVNPLYLNTQTGYNSGIQFAENNSVKWQLQSLSSGAGFRFYDNAAGAERMRLDSSGNLLVGTTSGTNARLYVVADGGAVTPFIINNTASGTAESTLAIWRRNGTNTGSISITGSLTLYNTTSDYRLKEVIGAVSGSGDRIDALQPVEYTWKTDGSRTRGFLAHQFQEVYANSVSGTKDAVDAEGKPVYQAMQAGTSEVIADLVAEIKSLRARVAALESN